MLQLQKQYTENQNGTLHSWLIHINVLLCYMNWQHHFRVSDCDCSHHLPCENLKWKYQGVNWRLSACKASVPHLCAVAPPTPAICKVYLRSLFHLASYFQIRLQMLVSAERTELSPLLSQPCYPNQTEFRKELDLVLLSLMKLQYVVGNWGEKKRLDDRQKVPGSASAGNNVKDHGLI